MMFYDVLCLKSILGFLLSERTSGVSPVIFYATGLPTEQTVSPGISGCARGLRRKSVESRQLYCAPGLQNLFTGLKELKKYWAPGMHDILWGN